MQRSSLILPEKYVNEHKQGLVNVFKKSLEKVINENQWRKEPYFIAYHDKDESTKPGLIKAVMKPYRYLPPLMARQIVYWVDNAKGFKEWLWTIGDDKKPLFNIAGVRKAKKSGALQVPKK